MEINDRQSLVLAQEAETLERQAPEVKVTNAEEYEDASELLKRIKGKSKELESARVRLKAPILESGRRVDEWFKNPLERLLSAEKAIKGALLSYRTLQEKKARAEEERLRLLVEAEQKRLAREALEIKMKADRDRQELERQAREAQSLRDRQELEAQAQVVSYLGGQAASNLEEKADELRPRTIEARHVVVTGQRIRKVWRFEVVESAVIPDLYKIVDLKKLGDVARGIKEIPPSIPGVRFYTEEIVVSEAI